MEENKQIIEYLEELNKNSKKRLFYSRITAVLFFVIVLFVGVMVPVVISTLNTAQTALVNANDAVAQAKDVMGELSVTIGDMDKAIGSIDKLVEDSSETMVSAFDNINSIDFEGLNSAIEDLGNVVEPLSKFFGAFR